MERGAPHREPAHEGDRRWRWLLAPWIWWTLALGYAVLAPLGPSPERDPPFGPPWQLGWGLVLLALLAGVLLGSRPEPGDERTATRRWRCALAALFLFAHLASTANYNAHGSGDTLPMRAIPLAVLAGDGLDLRGAVPARLHDHYSLIEQGGALLSAFPIGTGLLAVPYYAVVELVRPELGVPELFADDRFEKHLAALLAAAAAPLFAVAAGALHDRRRRIVGAVVLVLTTQFLPSLGQALWSTTGEMALVAAALALAGSRPRSSKAALAAGALLGGAFLCRPTAVLLTPLPFALIEPRPGPRRAFLAGFAVTAGAVSIGLLALYGHPLGGYAGLNATGRSWALAQLPEHLAGVLFSPSRGLTWFFPALVLGALVRPAEARVPGPARRMRWAAIASSLAIVVLTACYAKWWGGYSTGPRLLAEVSFAIPLLALPLLEAGRVLRRATWTLLAFQAALGLGLAHRSRAESWNHEVLVDQNPEVLWSVANSQIAAALVPGWRYLEPGPYLPEPGDTGARGPGRPVDLAGVANVRYDDRRARGAEHERLWLPRLAAATATARSAGDFGFLAPAAPNAVRVCAGEQSPPIPVGQGRVRALHTILLWRRSAAADEGVDLAREVGAVLVELRHGRLDRHPLREGRDVWDTTARPLVRQPPFSRLLAGKPTSRDALVRQSFRVTGWRRAVATIRVEGPPADAPGCLYLLAATTVSEPR